jgi:hypothetical protein
MIQYLSQPFVCSLSDNPLPFVIKAPNATPDVSVFPAIHLTVARYLLQNRFFSFQFTNPFTGALETVKFFGVVSPPLDGYFVPATVSGDAGPPQSYVEDLAAHMRANALLNTYYSVTVSNFVIQITARYAQAELIPTNWVLSDIQNSGGIFALNATILSEYWQAIRRPNHRVNVKVYFESVYNSGTFDLVAEIADTVNENGTMIQDVSSIIHSETKKSFDTPPLAEEIAPDEPNKVRKATVLRRYYIECAEQWNNMPFDKVWRKSDICLAHFGGVSLEDYSKIHPIQSLVSGFRFLTWWPDGKRLFASQPDWLSWMNTTGSTFEFDVNISVRFDDGTTTEDTLGSIELNAWETLTVPVGFEQLALDALAGNVVSWDINVTNEAEVDVTRRYYLIHDLNFVFRDMVYLNTYGVPECFRTTGFWKEELMVKKEVASRTLAHDYTRINGQSFTFQQISRNTFTARTGHLKKAEADALQAMMTTAPVFRYDKGYYSPVIIDGGTVTPVDESEILQMLEFKVTQSMELKTFSKEPDVPKLKFTRNCGRIDITVDYPQEVETVSNMEVFRDGASLSTLSPVGNAWFLSAVEITGNYYFRATVTIGGEQYEIRGMYDFKRTRVQFRSPDHGSGINSNQFEVVSNVNSRIYVNWEIDGTYELYNTPANVTTLIFKQTNRRRERNILVEHPCFESYTMFGASGLTYKGFHVDQMKNLDRLVIVNTSQGGFFTLVPWRNMRDALLFGNEITAFEVGLCRNLEQLDLGNNLMQAEALEDIVDELYKYRKLFLNTVFVTLTGNPGSGSISADATAKILGTGIYAGDGLLQNQIIVTI